MSGLPMLALAGPLLMLLACLSAEGRERAAALLPWAPFPALLAALLSGLAPVGDAVVLPPGLFNIVLILDRPGALLLGAASLLWCAAGFSGARRVREQPDRGRFAVWWLLTLTGSLGVFMAADLVSFYLMFALVSLPAYGLVVFDGSASAHRAGALYVALAVLGEAFLLLGFVILAQAAHGSLLIGDVVAALPGSAAPNVAIGLLIAGFGLKVGLVPLHIWMPLAYAAAPIPAAAVLSGAAVKAGVIGLIRFLPLHTALPGWGGVLTAVGFFSAFYGVAVGLTQTHSKTVLAYSSVSQMGVTAAVLGMGQSEGASSVGLVAAFYAANHVLVKGGLFLAAGLAARTPPSRRVSLVLVPAGLVGLSLAGLPLTGGAIAKWAIKGPLGGGAIGLLGTLSAAATTLLMAHFLVHLAGTAPSEKRASWGETGPWLGLVFAVLVLPWVIYASLGLGAASQALAPSALWSGLWPVLLGCLLAGLLRGRAGRLPTLPPGDIVILLDRAVAAAPRLGARVEWLDGWLREWSVAGASLLLIAVLLAATLLAGD